MDQHHEFLSATLFNRYVANPLAEALGFQVDHDVLPAHLVMVIFVCLILTAVAFLVRRRLSVDNPGAVQQLLEVLFEGLLGLMKEIIGSGARRFFPLIGTLFLYILAGNLLGLFPGFMPPTSNINITAACGIIVFLYYNYHGFRVHGFVKYMAHFAGPSLAIAPVLFVIEIISHLARPFSLSVRLMGNIYAEELIVTNLNQLFPFVVSMPVMALGLFAGTLQAFIFSVLTLVYIAGSVEHAHDEEH